MGDLFERTAARGGAWQPLADRMRPRTLDEVAGQEHLLGPGCFLRVAIETDSVPSLVFWGPPGTGKTTLARVIAAHTGARFVPYSAVDGTVKEVRKILDEARSAQVFRSEKTILFIDEIHRFNKAQQDVLLPGVEQGVVTLIGATTENPSFAVVSALLSRCKVVTLEPLSPQAVVAVLRRAVADTERGLAAGGATVPVTDDALEAIARWCKGDARFALGALEAAVALAQGRGDPEVTAQVVEQAAADKALLYDRNGEEHYNIVSAFIKSMRGSDPDGALYWMFRMLEGGEDPRFVLRRMLIFASEDVGNADPRALQVAVAADQAFARLGLPEGLYPLAQACTYLACAPKSNAQVDAIARPRRDIREKGPLPVPKKLRNAPTGLMRELGYGQGYRYPHDEGGYAPGETYLPDALVGRRYYEPRDSGLEASIRQRLEALRQMDRRHKEES